MKTSFAFFGSVFGMILFTLSLRSEVTFSEWNEWSGVWRAAIGSIIGGILGMLLTALAQRELAQICNTSSIWIVLLLSIANAGFWAAVSYLVFLIHVDKTLSWPWGFEIALVSVACFVAAAFVIGIRGIDRRTFKSRIEKN
jgi:hypothetical protein